MQFHPAFNETIGQTQVKALLSMFASSFSRGEQLPFLNFITARGCGKTHFARIFHSLLKDENGDEIGFTEVNAAELTVKKFFEILAPQWADKGGILFLDESHNLPMKLQQLFLTLLNTDKNPIRELNYDGMPYTFDMRKLQVIFATTDQQKLAEALQDRFTNVTFKEYSDSELLEIFRVNLSSDIIIPPVTVSEIQKCFRGHPRDAVKLASNLRSFCAAMGEKTVHPEAFETFRNVMNIYPYGLNENELIILRKLDKCGTVSLQGLASMTGFDISVIRKGYEPQLIKSGFMKIDGKRVITREGREFIRSVS